MASPYNRTTRVMTASGAAATSIDGLRGGTVTAASAQPAFNGAGEINASSTKDLMQAYASLMSQSAQKTRIAMGVLGVFCTLALLTAVHVGLESIAVSYVDLVSLQAGKADLLITSGARSVRAMATHPVLSGSGIERLNRSKISELITTDTIPVVWICTGPRATSW